MRRQIWLPAPTGLALSFCFLTVPLIAQSSGNSLGIFEGQSDVGSVTPPGTLAYEAPNQRLYHRLSWRESLVNDGRIPFSVEESFRRRFPHRRHRCFPTPPAIPVRIAKRFSCFVRPSTPTALYADAAQHGSGMTALQYRA